MGPYLRRHGDVEIRCWQWQFSRDLDFWHVAPVFIVEVCRNRYQIMRYLLLSLALVIDCTLWEISPLSSLLPSAMQRLYLDVVKDGSALAAFFRQLSFCICLLTGYMGRQSQPPRSIGILNFETNDPGSHPCDAMLLRSFACIWFRNESMIGWFCLLTGSAWIWTYPASSAMLQLE